MRPFARAKLNVFLSHAIGSGGGSDRGAFARLRSACGRIGSWTLAPERARRPGTPSREARNRPCLDGAPLASQAWLYAAVLGCGHVFDLLMRRSLCRWP